MELSQLEPDSVEPPLSHAVHGWVDTLADFVVGLFAWVYTLIGTFSPTASPIPLLSPSAVIVKVAFFVRIAQFLFKLFFFPFGFLNQIFLIIGLVAVVFSQARLTVEWVKDGVLAWAQQMFGLDQQKDAEVDVHVGEDDAASDEQKMNEQVEPKKYNTNNKKKLHAMKYARAAYGNGPSSLMFVDFPPKYNSFFLGSLLDLLAFLLDPIDARFHQQHFQYTIPDIWMMNCIWIETFEPETGFAEYSVKDDSPSPSHSVRYTPVFTPLAGLYRDCTFEPNTDVLVLVIRGSTTVYDWLVDLTCDAQKVQSLKIIGQEFPARYHRHQTTVHIGIFAAAYDLYQKAKVRIDKELEESHHEITKLVITGHSLGGGMAVYLTDLFQHYFEEESRFNLKVEGYAFAPPGCYGDLHKVGDLESKIQSFIFEADIVPRLSLGAVMKEHTRITNKVVEFLNGLVTSLDQSMLRFLPVKATGVMAAPLRILNPTWLKEDGGSSKDGQFKPLDAFNVGLVHAIKCHLPWFYDDSLRREQSQ